MSVDTERVRLVNRYIYGLAGVAFGAVLIFQYAVGLRFGWISPLIGLLFALLVLCARYFPVGTRIGKVEFEVSDLAILMALALGGPLSGFMAAVPGAVYRDRQRTIFQSASYALQVLAASFVLGSTSGPLLLSPPDFGTTYVVGLLGAGVAMYVVESLSGYALLRIKYGTPPGEWMREILAPDTPSQAVLLATALLTSYATVRLGPVAAIALFGGSALALGLVRFFRDQSKKVEELEDELSGLREERAQLHASNVAFAVKMVEKIGRKDHLTHLLAATSAVYAEDLAREFRLEESKIEKMKLAALLQDVGKVSLPDEVLLADPEKLTPEGRARLAEHPLHAEEILGSIPGYEESAQWVRWHHERIDGKGYPDGLRGEWIPLEAKILAAASHYASVVLTLRRAEDDGSMLEEARRELIDVCDRELDGVVVRTLLRIIEREGEEYALGRGERFSFGLASAEQGGGSAKDGPGLRLISGSGGS